MSDDLFSFEQEILSELTSGIPQLRAKQRRRRTVLTGFSVLAFFAALAAMVLSSLGTAQLNNLEVAGPAPQPAQDESLSDADAGAPPAESPELDTSGTSDRGSRGGDSTSAITTGGASDPDTDDPFLIPAEEPEREAADTASPDASTNSEASDDVAAAADSNGDGGSEDLAASSSTLVADDASDDVEPASDATAGDAVTESDDSIAQSWSVAQIEVRVDELARFVDAYVTIDGLQPCESAEVLSNVRVDQQISVQLQSSVTANCQSVDPMQVVFVPLGQLDPGVYQISANDLTTEVLVEEPFASISTTVALEYVAGGGETGGTIRLGYTPSEPTVCLSGSIARGFTRVPAPSCPESVTAGTQWYGDDVATPVLPGTSRTVTIDDTTYEFLIPVVQLDDVQLVAGDAARYESEPDVVTSDLAIAVTGSTSPGCHDTTGLLTVSSWVAQTRHRIQPTSPSCSGGGPFAVTSAFGPAYQGYSALVTVNGETNPVRIGGARNYPDAAITDLDISVEQVGDEFVLNLSLPVEQQVPCSSVTLSQAPLLPTAETTSDPLSFFAYETWLDEAVNRQHCPRGVQSLVLTSTALVDSPGDYVVSLNGSQRTVSIADPRQCVIGGVEVDSLMSREECSLIELTFTFDNTNLRSLRQTDPCTWEELRCDASGLVGVHLEDHWIRRLPPEFSQLKNLRYLGLVDQGYTELPPEIAGLTNLLVLRVADNDEMVMPDWIGNFQRLQLLEFERLVGRLPASFFTLTELKHLILADAPVRAVPMAAMPSVAALPNLVTLDLSRSEVSELPADLASHPTLRYLNVYSTRISAEDAEAAVGPSVEIVTQYLYSEIYRCRSAGSVLELLDLYNPWDRDPLSACEYSG